MILPENENYANITDVKAQAIKLKTNQLIRILNISDQVDQAIDANQADEEQKICTNEIAHEKIKEKYKHLSYEAKVDIIERYYQKNQSRSKIWDDLFVPYSTVWRVINEFKANSNYSTNSFNQSQSSTILDVVLKDKIKKFIDSTETTLTTKDIEHFLKEELNAKVKPRDILRFIKTELRLSYKRISSRPVLPEPARVRVLRKIFAIEFANIIDSTQTIVNIDEVLFSNATKSNYSWIHKGQHKFWNNICFKGSLSLICSITNKGEWFVSNLIKTNNSKTFMEYISELIKWLRIDLNADMNKIIIMLDNWQVHKSKAWLKYLNEFGWRILFLPAYSPDFAPIELLFNTLKRKITRQEKGNIVKLKSKEGMKSIKECLAATSKEEIVSYWVSAIKWISRVILEDKINSI